MRTMRAMAYLALAAAAWAVPAGAALAGKPSSGGGGGTGGGRIWYSPAADGVWTMNSDGTGSAPTGSSYGPLRRTYGGHAWAFSATSSGGLDAVRDDGLRVDLTDPAVFDAIGPADWVPGRDAVSWIARRNSGGMPVEGGLYVGDLVFAADGSISGLLAQPTAAAFATPLVEPPAGSGRPSPCPQMERFSWAPDGRQFAWASISTSAAAESVHVADLAGSDRVLVAEGLFPAWSPDGSRIAYLKRVRSSMEIRSVAVSGAGDFRVDPSSAWLYPGNFAWSPTGSHIAYTAYDGSKNSGYFVYRVAATGGAATRLTGGRLVGWTE